MSMVLLARGEYVGGPADGLSFLLAVRIDHFDLLHVEQPDAVYAETVFTMGVYRLRVGEQKYGSFGVGEADADHAADSFYHRGWCFERLIYEQPIYYDHVPLG